MRVHLWLHVGVATLAACYEPPRDACGIQCDTTCPDGFQCTTDHVCMPSGATSCPMPSVDFASVGLGAHHACGLDTAGAIYCWGDNSLGQVGVGNTRPIVPSATRVAGAFTALAVGGAHACGIANGNALCWGVNNTGQVLGGTGGDIATPMPVQVDVSPPAFDHIAAGTFSTCALGSGQLWCWGRQDLVGNGGVAASFAVRIGTLDDWQEISMGSVHTCGISRSQGLLCWGDNSHGQTDPGGSTTTGAILSPKQVTLPSLSLLHVFAGNYSTCVTMASDPNATSGQLWCWGQNPSLPGDADLTVPTQIGSDATWTGFDSNDNQTCGIRGGMAVCWGGEGFGALGDGYWRNAVSFDTPSVIGPADEIKTTIDLPTQGPRAENVCLRHGTTVSCLGEDQWGQLGIGVTSRHTTPIEIPPPGSGLTWKRIVAGYDHACATTSDDALWCWGADGKGQVSAGIARGVEQPCIASQPCDAPRPVVAPGGIHAPDEVITGAEYTCVRLGSTVQCWGDDANGLLGRAQSGSHDVTPVIAPNGGSWQHLYGGMPATCGVEAVATELSLVCWGYLIQTVLNDPTVITAIEIHDVAALRAGDGFACLLRSDSTRVCWGLDGSGQLGDGLATDNYTPTALETGVDQISADGSTACERAHGNILCWGSDSLGQAGGSTGTIVTAPTMIGTAGGSLDNCTDVAVATATSCAICAGVVWCWGDNGEGEFGNGTTTSGQAQAMLPAGVTATQLAVGRGANYALDSAGRLYAWGDGPNGELGDGGHAACLPTPVAP